MAYLLIATILGVFLGRFNINFYFLLFTILSSLFLFFKSYSEKNKTIFLFVFIIAFAALDTNVESMEKYSENQLIKDNFIILSKKDNNYIIKENSLLGDKYKIYSDKSFKIGDEITLEARVKNFDSKMNYYGVDYKKYYLSNGIKSKFKVLNIEKTKNISFTGKIQEKFISRVNSSLDYYLSKRNSNSMKSILLADTFYMEDEDIEYFRNIGISHILALSGLHIMIIIYFVDYFFKYFIKSKIKRRVFSSILIFIYLFFLGFPVGGLRAFIMSITLFFSFLYKKKYSSLNALCLSAIVLILINPNIIYSVSFLFSFTSVLSINLFYGRIKSNFRDNFLLDSLILTFSASILMLPLNLYFFEEFSILSFISNVLIIPIISLAIILSFVIVIFSFLAIIISPFLNLILNLSFYLIEIVNDYSFLKLSFYSFNIYFVIIYYVIIFIIFNSEKLRDFYLLKDLLKFYMIFCFVFLLIFNYVDYNTLKVDFLYVDQGDSSLISYRGKYYLVDTGGYYGENYSPGKIYTREYLRGQNIKEIEALFISHFDEDHCEGVLDLIDDIKFNRIYISYIDDNYILREILNKGIKTILLKKDNLIKLDDNTFFKVHLDSSNYKNPNDRSLVLSLNHFNNSILYTGDISNKVDNNIRGRFNILKVAHHGASDSSSEAFLDEITPKEAIISCGIDNPYNHPKDDLLERLNNRGINTFITSKNGQIRFVFNKDKYYIKTFKDNRE